MGSQFSYAAPLRSFGGLADPWRMPGAWLEDHLVPSPTDAQTLPIVEKPFPGEEYPPTEHFPTGVEDASPGEERYHMSEGHSPIEFLEPPPFPTVTPPSLYITTGISTGTASHVSGSERSPSLTMPTSPVEAPESLEAVLVEKDSSPALDDSVLSLAKHSTKICAEVMALGDQSLLVYQGMLSRLERLQPAPPSSSTEILSFVADCDLINPFSQLSQPIITAYFCEASDVKSALLLRQSINLVHIGGILKQLVQKVCLHHEDASILGRIGREIDFMAEADRQNNFGIQFAQLQTYRSRFSPAHGESFSEEHRFLIYHVEEYLEDKTNCIKAATQFLDDPASLTEHRLSHFFLT